VTVGPRPGSGDLVISRDTPWGARSPNPDGCVMLNLEPNAVHIGGDVRG
jgi:hypothetical protein